MACVRGLLFRGGLCGVEDGLTVFVLLRNGRGRVGVGRAGDVEVVENGLTRLTHCRCAWANSAGKGRRS